MKGKIRSLIMGVVIGIFGVAAEAAVVTYTTTHLGGTSWRYDYSVAALAGDPTIEEFTIFFGVSYANLQVAATPGGWDSIVVEPDAGIPADGYFDSLGLIAGVSPGASAAGFAVDFDFLGVGTPGNQHFEVVDPQTFEVLTSGFTKSLEAPPLGTIPEPTTTWLMLLAFGLVIGSVSHRRNTKFPQIH